MVLRGASFQRNEPDGPGACLPPGPVYSSDDLGSVRRVLVPGLRALGSFTNDDDGTTVSSLVVHVSRKSLTALCTTVRGTFR